VGISALSNDVGSGPNAALAAAALIEPAEAELVMAPLSSLRASASACALALAFAFAAAFAEVAVSGTWAACAEPRNASVVKNSAVVSVGGGSSCPCR
jgi:hypothetical protein